MSLQNELNESIKALVNLSDDDLEVELGRRLKINEMEIQAESVLSASGVMPLKLDEAELAGPREFLRNLAHDFLSRFNRQLYSLVCNPEDEDYKLVNAAMGGGAEKVALVVAGVLMAKFAWLPAIVALIASIVAKRAVSGAHESVCAVWKKQLEDSKS